MSVMENYGLKTKTYPSGNYFSNYIAFS